MDRLVVAVELELGSDPISGMVALGSEPATPFKGWLALIAALERAATGAPSPEPAATPSAAGAGAWRSSPE